MACYDSFTPHHTSSSASASGQQEQHSANLFLIKQKDNWDTDWIKMFCWGHDGSDLRSSK